PSGAGSGGTSALALGPGSSGACTNGMTGGGLESDSPARDSVCCLSSLSACSLSPLATELGSTRVRSPFDKPKSETSDFGVRGGVCGASCASVGGDADAADAAEASAAAAAAAAAA